MNVHGVQEQVHVEPKMKHATVSDNLCGQLIILAHSFPGIDHIVQMLGSEKWL